jgi:hypothetical protein
MGLFDTLYHLNRFLQPGDLLMSRTLDCVHSSMQPIYPYYKRFGSGTYEPNARFKSYESLEKKRYDRLGVQRLPTFMKMSVTRIYNERFAGICMFKTSFFSKLSSLLSLRLYIVA